VEYEYDNDKSELTFRERRIDFDFAARVFNAEFIEYEDQRRDWGEKRLVAIGLIEGRLFTVVYTWRNGRRRIISARRASWRERPTTARSRKRHTRSGRVDWPEVDATTEADIARQITGDPETAPELTEEALDRAVIVSPDGTRTPYRERVPRPQSRPLLPPGSRAPESGVYELVTPRGGKIGAMRTVARGNPLPPTPEEGQRWPLLDPGEGKATA
jgi:uncharacterized protein